jgi:peptidoglycan/xylan/chitin deacetylase (PgdA/CDA1 family)
MSETERSLTVVMYHYVRDLPRTRYPRIKGLLLSDFQDQVRTLCDQYEMATLESTFAFLDGQYRPQRDMCLLTFDDGLKEHFREVTPILAEHGVAGLFFVITGCLEQGKVASVHKNHFLMASLEFADYRRYVLSKLAELEPTFDTHVPAEVAKANYRWDTPDVAQIKYLLNFRLTPQLRERLLSELFAEHLGDERDFARELYVTWEEARQMQAAGMVLGGHTDSHQALATLSAADQRDDLTRSTRLLHQRLADQAYWPFSYPYGKPDSAFNATTMQFVRELGYCCAFSTQVGTNGCGQQRFSLRRIDTKDVQQPLAAK